MDNDLCKQLALIYVQAHATDTTPPQKIYALYKKADAEIRKAASDAFDPKL